MKKTGIFLFTQDLRLHDQQALFEASQNLDQILCLYLLDPRYDQLCKAKASRAKALWGIDETQPYGLAKQHFTLQSLLHLQHQLKRLNQRLLILNSPIDQQWQILFDISQSIHADFIYKSTQIGYYEQHNWNKLKHLLSTASSKAQCIDLNTYTLFQENERPFNQSDLPDSFSKFRKKVEHLNISKPMHTIEWLPPAPNHSYNTVDISKYLSDEHHKSIPQGGELKALSHLNTYFSEYDGEFSPARSYKHTRNALDEWTHSTKFSFWLSNGCLSVRTLCSRLFEYEKEVIANDSTYWIFFELLWREYFQCYAQQWGKKLYLLKGIKQHKPLTSFYGERFRKWCEGQTPYPIVNACMKQLQATGYMSNRGRQLVASCFVHELQLDWRYGAAYFERQLIDYDVGSNWGNWQYLAGVGADPRGHRRFDLNKQTHMYDPKHTFIKKWQGDQHSLTLDSVDLVDWPTHT